MVAADEGDFETAAEYLDLRNLRGAARELTGAQLARRLYVVIQRGEWIDVGDLVDNPRSDATRRVCRFLILPFGIWLTIISMNYIPEALNLRILEIVSEAGISLSPPAQALRIEQAAAAV